MTRKTVQKFQEGGSHRTKLWKCRYTNRNITWLQLIAGRDISSEGVPVAGEGVIFTLRSAAILRPQRDGFRGCRIAPHDINTT
jgi:hypothetical protein